MSGSAQTCWALIPIKGPGEGKTRLVGVLDSREREALVQSMLRNVVQAALGCTAIQRVCLVGPDDHGLGDVVTLIATGGQGLNLDLAEAVHRIGETGAGDRLIVISADLPGVDARDFALLARAPADTIVIAPDRHGTGTNALSIPVEAAPAFRFAFGADSYNAHRREVARLGYRFEALLGDGLEKDIDEPDDLADARE